jgi:Na+-driven multidrug efflux pump
MFIFAPQLIAIFRKDDIDVITIGARGLRLNCLSLPLMSIVVMSNMMTQTMGKALEASIVALSRQGIFCIPGLFILSPLAGLWGIQLAVPVSDLMCLIIVIPILLMILKLLSKPDEEIENAEPAMEIVTQDAG